jgi:hypothetical protein
MAVVRTNITLPEDVLALVDAVAGPRGRSRYIADVVARQVRRDNARMVFQNYAGALKDTDFWGRSDEEVLENLRQVRESWDRPWIWEEPDAVSAGHDRPDRSGAGQRRSARTHRLPVRRPE